MCAPIQHVQYMLRDEGFREQVIRQARDGQKGSLETLKELRRRAKASAEDVRHYEITEKQIAEVNRVLDEIEAAVRAPEMVSV